MTTCAVLKYKGDWAAWALVGSMLLRLDILLQQNKRRIGGEKYTIQFNLNNIINESLIVVQQLGAVCCSSAWTWRASPTETCPWCWPSPAPRPCPGPGPGRGRPSSPAPPCTH